MANVQIIDDDIELTENTAAVLKNAGHQVKILNDTDGAIDALLKDVPDLILLDVMFPEDPSAGMSLAVELHKNAELRKVPVIMLTGVNQHFPMNFNESDIDDEWLPVQRFIEKPFDLQKLVDLVAEVLAKPASAD